MTSVLDHLLPVVTQIETAIKHNVKQIKPASPLKSQDLESLNAFFSRYILWLKDDTLHWESKMEYAIFGSAFH